VTCNKFQTTLEDSSVPPQLSEHVLSELCFPSLTVHGPSSIFHT